MNNRQKQVQLQFLNNERAVIARLQYIYDQSLTEVSAKIRNLEFSIGDLQEQYEWLEDGDPAKEIIQSRIQAKIYQKQYQQVIQDQLDGILKKMQTEEFLTISDYLDTCYEDGFVGSLFDLHGQNVPMMMPLNQEAMVDAVQLDSKISQGLYTKLGEDVGVLKKRITSEVTRSIATGASWAQVAKRLSDQTKIGYNNSIRIARTEGHRIQCRAADDAAHLAKERGADVAKQWDATLDGKTRESHALVDGEIREIGERFSNGLMYPGDPAGSAAEVINCRCGYLQRARWALEGGFTKWNNFSDQLESFESPEAYAEFKKAFFSAENKKYMNYVQQMQDKYGTEDFAKVLDRMSEREYKHYSKLLANNPVYNKKAPAVKMIEDCTTVTEVENLFREQDWFIHGTGTLDGWRSDEGLSLNGCDVDCAKGIYSAYEHLFDRFPQLKNKLAAPVTGKLKRNIYAQCTIGFGSGAVQVNTFHFSRIKTLMQSYAEDVANGFHPAGTSGFAIVTHELGHAVDDYLSVMLNVCGTSGKKKSDFVSSKIRPKILKSCGVKVEDVGTEVSEYATVSPAEWFAECFAEYMCSDNPRPVAKAFGEWLEGIMKGVK